jgi:predicted GNAT family acetyltransferase
MDAETIAHPGEFLAASSDLLLEDEARHNLILGIAGTLRDHPAVYAEWRLWLVRDEGAPVAAALQTPPLNLVLARPRTPDALAPLADALRRDGVDLPGVTAALPEADAFAELWERQTNTRRRLRMKQRVYGADTIRPPAEVPGRPRAATRTDRDLLVSWLRAFTAEALGHVESPAQDSERWVDARLGGAGGFVVWEDDGPVSLAGWGGRTPNGIRIGPVYTPPEHRRRGYGSAVTAAASREQLAAGRRFCFLYTDLANPTSNRIYVDIGYEPVCDSVDYTFESP